MIAHMTRSINWTHLMENYRGQWVALAEDEVTVLAAGATAREVHEAAVQQSGQHFLYRVPETFDLFAGYAV